MKSMLNYTMIGASAYSLTDTVFLNLSLLSISVFLTSLFGILLEERIAVRLILLLEVCLASVIGYVISVSAYIGTLAFVFILIVLVVAAVESILLFGFIVLLHHLSQISDLSKLRYLQG